MQLVIQNFVEGSQLKIHWPNDVVRGQVVYDPYAVVCVYVEIQIKYSLLYNPNIHDCLWSIQIAKNIIITHDTIQIRLI